MIIYFTEVFSFNLNMTIFKKNFKTIFVSSHMYPENPEGTRVIVGSLNMGYDIYPTLQGLEHATCSVTKASIMRCIGASTLHWLLWSRPYQILRSQDKTHPLFCGKVIIDPLLNPTICSMLAEPLIR